MHYIFAVGYILFLCNCGFLPVNNKYRIMENDPSRGRMKTGDQLVCTKSQLLTQGPGGHVFLDTSYNLRKRHGYIADQQAIVGRLEIGDKLTISMRRSYDYTVTGSICVYAVDKMNRQIIVRFCGYPSDEDEWANLGFCHQHQQEGEQDMAGQPALSTSKS